MSESVLRQLAELRKLDHDGLCRMWRTLYGTEPPTYVRKFLLRRLAYRIQEIAHGGLSDETKRKMRAVLDTHGFDENGCKSETKHERGTRQATDAPIAGTKFVRTWNGQHYEVTAIPGGFEYDGRRYRSLTAVAKAITGTHWNGRVFFGGAPKVARKGGDK